MTPPTSEHDADRDFVRSLEKVQSAFSENNPDDMAAAVQEVFAAAASLSHAQTPSSPIARSYLAIDAADEAEFSGKWEIAREIYDRSLAELIVAGDLPLQVRFHLRLAALDRRRGNLPAAFDSARQAVATARAADLPTLEEMAIREFASLAVELQHYDEALAAIASGLEVLQEMPLHALPRAELETIRAKVLLRMGNLPAADEALASASQMFDLVASGHRLPGIQWRLGDWWHLQAKRCQRQSNLPAARTAWRSCLDCKREAVEQWRQGEFLSPLQFADAEADVARLGEESASLPDLQDS